MRLTWFSHAHVLIVVIVKYLCKSNYVASAANKLPCLPFELAHGYWKILDDLNEDRRMWKLFSDCEFTRWKGSYETSALLNSMNISIVWNGNSIVRHLYFRLGELLSGSVKVGEDNVKGLSGEGYDRYNREIEKRRCVKNFTSPQDYGKYEIKVKKGLCTGCGCGACSCYSIVSGLSQYFSWQEEWYDDFHAKAWRKLLARIEEQGKWVFLVMNAGFVFAGSEGSKSIDHLLSQADQLKRFIEHLPLNVTVLYLLTSSVKTRPADYIVQAQNAVIEAVLSSIPPERRPIVIDQRMVTMQWYDFIDNCHFGGATADVVIDSVLHIIRHYDTLYTSDHGRGRLFQDRNTNLCSKPSDSVVTCKSSLEASHSPLRPFGLREGQLVHVVADDSKTVYLVQNRTLRPFPNRRTFTSMGFHEENITHIHAHFGYHIGYPLRNCYSTVTCQWIKGEND